MFPPVRSWALLLALSPLALGCAAQQPSDAEDSEGARITQKEAAKDLNVSQQILSHEPATAGNTLGIAKWDVYVESNNEAKGLVAFATDDTAAADVKYALVVDTVSGRAAVLQYDKDGVKKQEPPPLSSAVKKGLQVELEALKAKLGAQGTRASGVRPKAAGDASSCALELGIYALGAIGVVIGGVPIAMTVGAAVGTGVAISIGVFGVGISGMSAWVISVMSETWEDTSQTCKRAVND